MFTVTYLVSLRAESLEYEGPGSIERPCAECGNALSVAPSTVGIMERHPAALLLCPLCALRLDLDETCMMGLATQQTEDLLVYFRVN